MLFVLIFKKIEKEHDFMYQNYVPSSKWENAHFSLSVNIFTLGSDQNFFSWYWYCKKIMKYWTNQIQNPSRILKLDKNTMQNTMSSSQKEQTSVILLRYTDFVQNYLALNLIVFIIQVFVKNLYKFCKRLNDQK